MGVIPCEIPLLEFDPEQTAVIGPDYEQLDLHLPRKCVFAFLGGCIDRCAHAAGARQVAAFNSATKLYPIYVTTYHGQEVALCQAPVGAAAAAQLLDWLISYGVREIISAGSCGVLTPFDEGTFLVPCKALRDEGASYHYAPPSRYIEISEPARRAIEQTILAHHMRYQEVVTWTASSVRRRRRSPTAKARAAPWRRWSALPLRPVPPSAAPLGGCFFIQRTALLTSSATTSGTGAAAPMNTPSPCVSTPFWPSDPKFSPSADAKEALMNHTVHIRSVKPGDAPQLAHIQTESWKAAFREIIPAGILSEYTDPEPVTRMYEHLLTHGSAHGYILELDGAPHGIAWWDAAREPDMAGTAELICIHSLSAHWHQGYGKLLLEKVLRDVKSAGYPSILLWVFDANLPAIRFYQSLGFTASGRKRPSFGSVEEMYTKAL